MIIAFIISAIITILLYHYIGWQNIVSCYKLWMTREYWTNYNIIEAISWASKLIIIIPGLIFQIELLYVYFITLVTSILLIWASNKKMLPSLVAFNTIWIFLSIIVITKRLL